MTDESERESRHDKVDAYAAHWRGEECTDCGKELEWDSEERTLSCDCEERDALSVYLGNTPNVVEHD